MISCAHEHDQSMFTAASQFVRAQKVAADMALPMAFPVATLVIASANTVPQNFPQATAWENSYFRPAPTTVVVRTVTSSVFLPGAFLEMNSASPRQTVVFASRYVAAGNITRSNLPTSNHLAQT